MQRRITVLLAGILLLTGCFKSVSYDTQFVLKPWMQQYNQYQLVSLPNVLLYAYAVDTAAWTVASYDDALAGVLTSIGDPSQRLGEPYASGVSFGEVDTIPSAVDWRKMRLKLSSAMILAVDTEDKLYAYTQQQLYENLSPLYVSVTFQPWRELTRYHYGGWTFVNEFYDPTAPKKADYLLKPFVQTTEEAPTVPLDGVAAYAYALDTLEWRIASYDDAAAGIVTSKTDPGETRNEPTYRAVPSTDPASQYWLQMTATEEVLMVVAVDPADKLYAYTKQKMVPGGAPVDAAVTFTPWRSGRNYASGPWRMVNDFYVDPGQPDNPDPDTPATPIKRR